MATIKLSNEGYDYCKNREILFSTDRNHLYLFDYVAKDLSCLPKLFEQYIVQRMDITTFEPKKKQVPSDDFNDIKKILLSLHPYCKYEYEKVVLNAIGYYFNQLLLFSVYRKELLPTDCPLDKNWYYPRLHSLIPASINVDANYPSDLSLSDFYKNYQDLINYKFTSEDPEAETVISVPKEMPVGFSTEIYVQDWAHDLLYFTLDSSAEHMDGLSSLQRAWLYGNIFPTRNLMPGIPRKLLFRPTALFSKEDINKENGHYWNEDLEYDYKMNEMFHPFYATPLSDIRAGIPENLTETFLTTVEYAKTNKSANFYEVYEINEFQELLFLEITSMIQSETIIRKCENCGKYFVQNGLKKKYCDRRESGRTCAQQAKNKLNQQRNKTKPGYELYHNAYSKTKIWLKNNLISKEEFNTWLQIAKRKYAQANSKEIDISAFEEFLNETAHPAHIKKLK